MLFRSLPPTLAFALSPAPTSTAGTFTTSGNTGTWTIGALLPLTTQTLTFTVSVLSAATPTSTAFINTASIVQALNSPSGVTALPDPVSNNNVATASVIVTPSANLAVSKSNGTNTVVSGGTTAYTITVTNNGPYTATAATLRDPVAAGLSCGAVTCTSAVTAVCPAPASVTIAALQGTGVAVTLPPASTLQFVVTCGVTATGAWLDPSLWQGLIDKDMQSMAGFDEVPAARPSAPSSARVSASPHDLAAKKLTPSFTTEATHTNFLDAMIC